MSAGSPTTDEGRLTSADYWRHAWSSVPLPYVTRPLPDVVRILRGSLPRGPLRLLEIGCAPGGWMGFFHKEFGYPVAGVEYVPEAAELARKNLELLGVEGRVICEDFFEMDASSGAWEVVFSGGFIEHFEDTDDVVARIASLASRYVVTLVPNLFGMNGAICRAVRREVYDMHVRIDLERLRAAHERAGLTTRFCGYVGGIRIINVAEGTRFFDEHPHLAAGINRPVDYVNQALSLLNRWTTLPLSSRWWSPSVLYVGQKSASDEAGS